MPVLKLWKKHDKIFLADENKVGEFVNITSHPSTKIMPKDSFLSNTYKIDDDVYITRSDFIINLAIKKHPHPNISALYCSYKNSHIIIIPKKSYCFYNGRNIEPVEFSILNFPSPLDIEKQLASI